LITVPAFQALRTSHDEVNHHFVRYRRRSLNTVVAQAGLNVVSSRYFFHWLFPVKLGVRVLARFGGARRAYPTVPPAFLNRLLLGIARLEQDTVGRLGVPFGSSLLAWSGAAA